MKKLQLDYTVEVLEEAPVRVTKFLHGVGAVPVVRTLLANAGMTDDELVEGRTLLLACLAEPRKVPAATDTEDAAAQRAAAAELDQWDEPNFARYRAALRRKFRSAEEYVFADGLKAATGADAVRGVATFLARVDALDKGSDAARAEHRKQDSHAVALLAERGLTHDERKRLKRLVDVALGPTTVLDAPVAPDDGGPDDARLRKLNALRGWFDEWAETARAVVKKHGYLVQLGLAARKKKKKPAPAPPGTGTASTK